MAGLLKPIGVGAEATWVVNDLSAPYNTNHNNALFDGIQGLDYTSNNSWYWYQDSIYLDITFSDEVNIWSFPSADGTSWTSHYGSEVNLKVEKWNGESWTDITSTTTQNPNSDTQWVKIFPNLLAGRYRFKMGSPSGYRMEGEWFVEKANVNKYLIQDGTEIKKFNPPVYSSDLIPTLTENNAPSPYVVSASTEYSGYPAYKAFNNTTTYDSDSWVASSGNLTGWLKIDLGIAKTVTKYTLTSVGGSIDITATPKNWTFEASNTGSFTGEQLILDSRSNQTDWVRGETRSYTFDNTTGYRYYRLNITLNNGFVAYVGVGELELMETTTVGSWSIVGTAPVTKTMFDTNGMSYSNLLSINNTDIQNITSNSLEILHWTDEESNYTANVIPAMTSNSTTINNITYVASASDEYLPAWRAFDYLNSSSLEAWMTRIKPTLASPQWLKFDFGVNNQKVIKKYQLTASTNSPSACSPKDWSFQGSNDDVNWTDLDSQTNQTGWTVNLKKSYPISNSNTYRFYRLLITDNNGDASYTNIGELEMMELVDVSRLLKLTAIPEPRIIFPTSNLNLTGNLQNLILDTTESGNGMARVIISGDNGITWKALIPTWDGNYTSNIIPVMTSSTTPSGIASTSSIYNAAYDAWCAFNNGYWNSATNVTSAWIAYDFNTTSKTVAKYSIDISDPIYLDWAPKDWIFEATNDGTNWIALDTQTNITNWNTNPKQEFTINNSTSYKKYRLYVSSANGANSIQIRKLEMFEKTYNYNWSTVNINDLNDVKSKAITATTLNNATSIHFQNLSPNNNFTIAYYLDICSLSDVAKINKLSATETTPTSTPSLSGITLNYNAYDQKYYGILFLDSTQNYYSTSLGEILEYLDFGKIIAGQTSAEVQVFLKNSLPFQVQNISITNYNTNNGITIELSKTTGPFIAQNSLTYNQILDIDQEISFYVRLTVPKKTPPQSGVTFDILAKADPV